ncbi:MAG: alpha-glucan family phosphorylase [Acidimicrobiia bacterium]|nr:alpha-glucan family phosphorylase [Acidimicrobiia bacterium]
MMLEKIPVFNSVAFPVPQDFDRVVDIANNLWWSWNSPGHQLWTSLAPRLWEQSHNPVELLRAIGPEQWHTLTQSESFTDRYRDAVTAFEHYMDSDDTWHGTHGRDGDCIAYFCTEYGIDSSLPIYSGGLGILAGDHLKSASDLGLPLVGVGLLYRRGYFHQEIEADGDQQHIYPTLDLDDLPVRPVTATTGGQLRVSIEVPGRVVQAAVWRVEVGRIPLLLLDTDVPENRPSDRPITHTLYVRGREMRFAQELILGVGGVKALDALGIAPTVWHVNEGHAAMSMLERLRNAVGSGIPLDTAREQVKERTLFTLHTPVPAGNEKFDRALSAKYLGPVAEGIGVEVGELNEWASSNGEEMFDLGALAIRFANNVNGVSARHGEIVTRDWSHLIGHEAISVTNGVHTPTWMGREGSRMLRNDFGMEWATKLLENPDDIKRLSEVNDYLIWQWHQNRKDAFTTFARGRLRRQFARHGQSPDELGSLENLLPTDRLTLGFARRFATYKRATLLFNDLERITELLANPDRPVQLVFAGKAHPADDHGQALIRRLVELSRLPQLVGHIHVLEDYDARIARYMVQGCDVWVNSPRPPMEASGTSGMKAAINGVPNLSVLDGWWVEGYTGDNGWVFGSEEPNDDWDAADAHDADDFYRVLEEEVAPLFFDRDDEGLPTGWIEMMRRAIDTSLVRFSAHRMVAEYYEKAYHQQ